MEVNEAPTVGELLGPGKPAAKRKSRPKVKAKPKRKIHALTKSAVALAKRKPKTKPRLKAKPKKIAKPRPKKSAGAGPARLCRLDIRLTNAEKAKLQARAAKTRRTITSMVLELIERMK